MRNTSTVGVDNLRTEAMADLFAAIVLLEASARMAKIEERSFDIWVFVQELLFLANTLFVIDRCSRTVKIALEHRGEQAELIELLVCPSIALNARSFMLRPRLELIVARQLYGEWPTDRQSAPVSELMNHLNSEHLARADRVETGLSRAMEFLLYPGRRASLFERLECFRIQLLRRNAPFQGELNRFVALADELGSGAVGLLNFVRILAVDSQNMCLDSPSLPAGQASIDAKT